MEIESEDKMSSCSKRKIEENGSSDDNRDSELGMVQALQRDMLQIMKELKAEKETDK